MNALVIIMAGGKGSRLYPLCRDRCKPAVPFGGRYRVIDFVLSNFTNAGFYKIKVLTQFMSDSLNRHIQKTWRLTSQLDHYVDILPPQMRDENRFYIGTADAVYQNLPLIEEEDAEHVFIFGADHIYKMDISQMLDYHLGKNADMTISALPVPLERADQMGIIEADEYGSVKNFVEKPANPKPMPGDEDMAFVSMGNYIFRKEVLLEVLEKDNLDRGSAHDFGRDIIPGMIARYRVSAYDFTTNEWPGMEEKERGYWCDVGSIDTYWEANIDLCHVTPRLNLYNRRWPIRSALLNYPPAKFVFSNEKERRIGRATDSLVSEGCIISGGDVIRSVLSPGVRINSFASVTDSVLMEGVEVGRHCSIKKAIIDKNVCVPPHTVIGYDPEHDKKRFYVTDSGIVVIPKNEKIYQEKPKLVVNLDI
jgi:glucose-1-phosphate adenylyltransferase